MIGLSYSSKPVGFRAILMPFLSFLSQKRYPNEFSRPEVVWNRFIKEKLVFKMSVEAHQFEIFKSTINSEMLGVKG